MCGWGRGWWHGRRHRYTSRMGRYTYIGPCRCGWGPHAFYVDEKGRILHASQVIGYPFAYSEETTDIRAELEELKREKAEIEERIKELEKQLASQENQ